MRFSTLDINLSLFASENFSGEKEESAYDLAEKTPFIQFNYDFPDVAEDSDARKLEPSDADLEIMVSLAVEGFHSGEQEFWFIDEDDNEISTSLVWKVA